MTNVIFFPCAWQKDGGIWHGGRFFKDVDELADALSDRDWARLRQWELRRLAWRQRGSGSAQGGGSAA
jgi:hypothetical protein